MHARCWMDSQSALHPCTYPGEAVQLYDVPSDSAYEGVVHKLHRVRNSCSTQVLLQEHSVTVNFPHHGHVKSTQPCHMKGRCAHPQFLQATFPLVQRSASGASKQAYSRKQHASRHQSCHCLAAGCCTLWSFRMMVSQRILHQHEHDLT